MSELERLAGRKPATAAAPSSLEALAGRKTGTTPSASRVTPEQQDAALQRLQAADRPDMTTTAIEMIKGAGKGLASDTISTIRSLMTVMQPGVMLANQWRGDPLGRAIGLDRVEAALTPSNPEQMAGRVVEAVTSLLAPGARGWTRPVPGVAPTTPGSIRLLKGGQVVKAVAPPAPVSGRVNLDAELPAILRQIQADSTAAARPLTAELPPNPSSVSLPYSAADRGTDAARRVLQGRAPAPTPLQRPVGAQQTTTGLTPVARPIEAPAPGQAPALGPSATTGTSTLPVTLPPRPPVPIEVTSTGTAMVNRGSVPGVTRWTATTPPAQVVQETVRATVTPAAEIAQTAEAAQVPVTQAFAELMASKGAVISETATEAANTVGASAAADAIEAALTRQLEEGVKALRRLRGAERTGDILFGNSKRRGVTGLPPGTVDRATRTATVRQLAPGPSQTPLVAEEAQRLGAAARALKDEKGHASVLALTRLLGGTAGAAAGATQGDTPEDRALNAVLGGATGAVLIPALAHAVATRSPQALQQYVYTSILSSPTSVAKAWMGAMGGTTQAAVEKILGGNPQAGARILRTLFSPQSVQTFLQALRSPATAQMSGVAGGNAPNLVARLFGAGDAVARRALAAGGISQADAARFTLAGAPTTGPGVALLSTLNQYFSLRLMTSLFPRVGIQVLERGLERTPLGLVRGSRLATAATRGEQTARAVLGPAAGAAAYAGSDAVPEWAKPYLAAVSGVYALPVAAGLAAGSVVSRGKSGGDAADAVIEAVASNLPFPQYGPTENIKQWVTGAPLVPNVVRDVARARDPYERDTTQKGGGYFARTKAKIPGLRETLPAKGRNVNVVGQPTDPRSQPWQRFLLPSSPETRPLAGLPESVAQELTRLDVAINPPSFRLQGRVGRTDLRTLPVPPDVLERARAERRQYVVPQIEKLLASPAYQRATDAQKKQRLEAVIKRAEAAGDAKARARVVQTLRAQGLL